MKRILILCHVLLLSGASWAQTCGLTEAGEIPNANKTFSYHISNVLNSDLSDPGQGVCRVEVSILIASTPMQLNMRLVSPSGQMVQLIGPQTLPGFLGFGYQLGVSFVPSGETAAPDVGYPSKWDNTIPGGYLPAEYRGVYYPHSGNLEDFNTGSVNGEWQLITDIDPGFLDITGSELFDLRIILCDDQGQECCFAEGGNLLQDDFEACEGSDELLLDLPPTYAFSQIEADDAEYGYTYAVSHDNVLLEFNSTVDLRAFPAGNYEICGLSFKRSEQARFPTPDGMLTMDSLRNNLQDVNSFFCGELSSTCIAVTILPIPPILTRIDTICQGDSLFIGTDTLTASGFYTLSLPNNAGCDTIIEVDLSVFPSPRIDSVQTICAGDSLVIGNSVYKTSGLFSDTLQTVQGCDSIINLDLTVVIPLINVMSDTICAGETYMVGDSLFTESGLYQVHLFSGTGCDSAVVVDLTVLEIDAQIAAPDTINCRQSEITLSAAFSPLDTLRFFWFDVANNRPLGQDNVQTVNSAGDYYLEVIKQSGGRQCSLRDTVSVVGDLQKPTALAGPPDALNCSDKPQLVLGDLNSSQGPEFTYRWSTTTGHFLTDSAQLQVRIDSGGVYELIVQNQINGCADTSSVTIVGNNTPPVADAGLNQLITCTNPTPSLDGGASTQGANLTYRWNALSGSLSTTADPLRPQVTEAGVYQLIVQNSLTACADTALVEATADNTPPSITIDEPEVINCNSPSIRLNAQLANEGNNPLLQWTALDGSGLVDGENSLNPQIEEGGDYQLLVINPENGCLNTAPIRVDVDISPPIVDIRSPDTLRCDSHIIQLEYTGNGNPNNLEYSWSDGQGRVLSNATSLDVNAPGTYSLRLVSLNNGCEASNTVEVIQDQTPPPLTFGDLIKSCDTDTFPILVSTNLSPANYAIEWTGDHIIDRQNEWSVRVGEPGDYLLELTELSNACVFTYPIAVTEPPCGPCLEAAAPPVLTCAMDSIQLEVSYCDNCIDCMVSWTTNDGLILSGVNSLQPQIARGGTYTISVVDSFNITKTLDVFVPEDRQAPIADAGRDTLLNCEVPTVILGGSNTSEGPDFQIRWYTEADPAASLSDAPSISIDQSGVYFLEVQNLNNACLALDSAIVLSETLPPLVSAGPDTSLTCSRTSLFLDGSASASGPGISYLWTTEGSGQIDQGENGIMPEASMPGLYTLTVFDENTGCSASDQVIVSLDNAQPEIRLAEPDTLSCINSSLLLQALNSDTAAFQYRWRLVDEVGNEIDSQNGPAWEINSAGLYNLEIVNFRNGCANQAMLEIIADREPPLASAGSDQSIGCQTDGISLNGTADARHNYLWRSPDSARVDMANTLSPQVFEPGLYILNVENPENGCSNTDTVEVVDDLDLPQVFAGSDTLVNCYSNQIQLAGLASANSDQIVYAWTTNNGQILSGENTSEPIIEGPGQYVLTITNLATACIASDTLSVSENLEPPQAQIAQDVDNLLLTCSEDTLNLDASSSQAIGDQGLAYLWRSLNAADDLIGNPAANTIEVAASGAYQIEVQDLENGCRDTLIFQVEADLRPPQIDILAPETLTCGRTEITIDATASEQGSSISYRWFQNGQLLPDTNLTFIASQAGDYQLESVSSQNGCVNTTTVSVPIDTLAPKINILPPAVLDCNNNTATLDASATEGRFLRFQWNTQNGSFLAGQDESIATVNSAGRYDLLVSDGVNSCIALNSVDLDFSGLQISRIDLDFSPPSCPGEQDGQIRVLNLEGGLDPYVFALNSDAFTTSSEFSNLSSGSYELKIMDASGCETDTTFVLPEPEAIAVSLGPDQEIKMGEEIILEAITSVKEPASVFWSPAELINRQDTLAQVLQPRRSATYQVVIANENGCTASDEVRIMVSRELPVFVANIFSPNGDGENDRFFIQASGAVSNIKSFMIFDRWGVAVFQGRDLAPNDPNLGWDGRYQGRAMNAAVFVYIAELEMSDGEVFLLEGEVVLMR